jgi:hypothetical protein
VAGPDPLLGVPELNDPTVAPPISEVSWHPPSEVNVGPAEITAGAETVLVETTLVPVTVAPVTPAEKLAVVPDSPPVRVPPDNGR